jgi:hypothetical protein
MTTHARETTRQADAIVPFEGLAYSWKINTNGWRVNPGAFRRTIQDAEARRKRRDGTMLWPILSEHRPELAFGWVTEAKVSGADLVRLCRKLWSQLENEHSWYASKALCPSDLVERCIVNRDFSFRLVHCAALTYLNSAEKGNLER